MIALKNVNKLYKKKERTVCALSDINLTVDAGQFLSITGPSGSGKTTLMNILGCLDYPSSGEYLLNGTAVIHGMSGVSSLRNRTIGFVFQNFNLLPHLNAVDNVCLPLLLRGVPRNERVELARSALEKVGLSGRMGHFPKELSGGQQQRVAIARAIVGEPSLILADEPTGNLDKPSSNAVIDLLTGINRSGKTLIIITHDDAVASVAPRRAAIIDGKLYENQ